MGKLKKVGIAIGAIIGVFFVLSVIAVTMYPVGDSHSITQDRLAGLTDHQKDMVQQTEDRCSLYNYNHPEVCQQLGDKLIAHYRNETK